MEGSASLYGEYRRHGKLEGALSAPRRAMTSSAAIPVMASAVLAALILSLRFAPQTPSLRASIETALTLCVLASTTITWSRFSRNRSLADFLFLCGLATLTVEDSVFYAAPAILGSHSASVEGVAPLTEGLIVAAIFLGASLAPWYSVVRVRQLPVIVITALGTYLAVSVASALAGGTDAGLVSMDRAPVPSAAAVGLTTLAACLLVAAGATVLRTFLRQGRGIVAGMLSGALFLLAAASVYNLLVPGLTPSSVSGRECLRAAAYALILAVSLQWRRELQEARLEEVAGAERRRLVRDLHDGMAQDLAFIAAHGERMARDLGPDHPLVIAARRALATSRGYIADLSASEASGTTQALEAVARELTARHGVRVNVEASGGELPPGQRQEVVRITREAIVNAIQHGAARTITVGLAVRGLEFTLSIRDDGEGIGPAGAEDQRRGHGLRTMRERTETIGGRMTLLRSDSGGLIVKVSVP